MSRDELRSQLYAFLGGATSTADGDEWDHGRLRALIDSLVELPAMRGVIRCPECHPLAEEAS